MNLPFGINEGIFSVNVCIKQKNVTNVESVNEVMCTCYAIDFVEDIKKINVHFVKISRLGECAIHLLLISLCQS